MIRLKSNHSIDQKIEYSLKEKRNLEEIMFNEETLAKNEKCGSRLSSSILEEVRKALEEILSASVVAVILFAIGKRRGARASEHLQIKTDVNKFLGNFLK